MMKKIYYNNFSRTEIKTLAFIFMIIDHIGAILFPQIIIFRIIGRLSFPLFAYLIADGCLKTSNPVKMILRLLLFGLISQPFFSYAFYNEISFTHLNVFFTLCLGAICSTAMCKIDTNNPNYFFIVAVYVSICVIAGSLMQVDYSFYGVFLVFIFAFTMKQTDCLWIQKTVFCLILFVTTLVNVYMTHNLYLLSTIFAGVFIPYSVTRQKKSCKWAYVIYPAHLFLLCLIRSVLIEIF